jgi:UDPglucose--hexose-1-phosphate uridylyltransferase
MDNSTHLSPFMSTDSPHRRFNALTGDWILVSPHRTKRPWQGKQEAASGAARPAYDPKCYLCPGNERMGGGHNPPYEGTFVFDNDFAAILKEKGPASDDGDGLLRSEPVSGVCRVICFSPRHDLTLPEMSLEAIGGVIDVWAQQTEELGRTYRWVQVFENKGDVMGCSNPHPHGQIWASDSIPNEPAKEDRQQRARWEKTGSPLLVDYLERELKSGERLIAENADWVALVPYWATWPYESLLLPRRPGRRLPDLTSGERASLADILKRLLTRYDNLFQVSFPYSMGWHGAPTASDEDYSHWQLHAHFYPPLLRSATVKKFMVGYEMLGEAQRDITPEQAAQTLREQSETHFKEHAAQ